MPQSLPQFPFYSALWNGFYNQRFYASAATHWRGRGFGYLCFAVAVGLLPLIVTMALVLKHFYSAELPYMLRQMPDITFSQGRAYTEAAEPQVIYTSYGKPLIMIAPSSDFTTPNEAGVMVLLTADALLVQRGDSETRRYALDDIQENTVLTADLVEDIAMAVKFWLLPFVALGMWLLFSFGRLIQAFFYALLGMAFAAALKVKLEFSALLQIAMIAVGQVVLVTAVFVMLFGSISIVISIPLALFYVWFGIKSTRDWAADEPHFPKEHSHDA